MPKVLRNLSVQFGSLVDEPANKGARIMLFKRDDTTPSPKDARGAGYCPPKDDEDDDEMKGKKPMKKESAEPTGEETLTAKVADLEKQLGERDAKIAELEKAAKPEPTEEDVLKSMPESVRKRIEDAETQAKEAQAVAKAERDARVTREYIAKAGAFSALTVNPETFGPVLKRLNENAATDEDRAELDRVLKAANTAVEAAEKQLNLYGETGRPGGDAASATDRLNALAKQLVTDGKASDYAVAIDQITKSNEHAGLMREYQAERGRRN